MNARKERMDLEDMFSQMTVLLFLIPASCLLRGILKISGELKFKTGPAVCSSVHLVNWSLLLSYYYFIFVCVCVKTESTL